MFIQYFCPNKKIIEQYLGKIYIKVPYMAISIFQIIISKKNLKKALEAMGIEITLSNSANILAQTFGFKHEHELQENLKKAIRRGRTTQHEIEELSRLYESYVELGGNGAIKILFEKFLKLEISEEK